MEIVLEVHDAPKFVLREAVGDGQCEGYDFGYYSTIPDHSFYVTLDDKAYIIKAADIIQAVIAAHIRTKSERPNYRCT